MPPRNEKSASAESSGRDAQRSVERAPQSLVTNAPARQIRGGALAERVFRRGGLRDRLRKEDAESAPTGKAGGAGGGGGREAPGTRCPACGRQAPGFVDCPVDDQEVVCESCGHETTYGRWVETAELADAIDAHLGDYALTWREGHVTVAGYDPAGRSRPVATVDTRSWTVAFADEATDLERHALEGLGLAVYSDARDEEVSR